MVSCLKLIANQDAVTGIGVEIDENLVAQCIEDGLQVVQADIETGLNIFDDGSFDCVVLSETLHELNNPVHVFQEMMRIGKQAIIVIANAAHISNRFSFLAGNLPDHENDNQSNFQTLITVADFEKICNSNKLTIKQKTYLGSSGPTGLSLLAKTAVYLLEKNS